MNMFSSMLPDLREPSSRIRYGLLGNLYEDYLNPPYIRLNIMKPRHQPNSGQQSDAKSESNFKVMLNVKHFRPDEIDVKTVDNYVVIHGKHEEHADEHGFVSREFTRRYPIPKDVEPNEITSSLSKDGVLTIQSPRKVIEPPKNERIVPITMQQHAAVEDAQNLYGQGQQETEANK